MDQPVRLCPGIPASHGQVRFGEWHVLLRAMHVGNADEDGGLIGGRVMIETHRLTLLPPGDRQEPLLPADCKLLHADVPAERTAAIGVG